MENRDGIASLTQTQFFSLRRGDVVFARLQETPQSDIDDNFRGFFRAKVTYNEQSGDNGVVQLQFNDPTLLKGGIVPDNPTASYIDIEAGMLGYKI